MIPQLPYRILAVDPATTKSGWAILDVISLEPLKIVIVAHAALDGQKLLRTRKEMSTLFPAQFCVLDALLEEYERLITLYKPDQIVSEGAFGHLHLAALIALTLAINVLRRASKRLLNKNIIEVPPTISKLSFTGKGGADKDHMRLAYQTNVYLDGTVADELISEHEIDAISHGVAHVRRDIVGDVVQLSAKERRDRKRAKAEAKAAAIAAKKKTT